MLFKSGCHRLTSHSNSQSLSFTADLSPISIPTCTFNTTLHALFGKELDNWCKCSYSHTHRLLKWPSTCTRCQICTWDVVQSSFHLVKCTLTNWLAALQHTAYILSDFEWQQSFLTTPPQWFWMATELPYNTDHRLSKHSAWAQPHCHITATTRTAGCGLAATDMVNS